MRASIVLVLVMLAGLGSASAASAGTDFGVAWYQPQTSSGGSIQMYGGYVREWSGFFYLGDYTKDFIDNDFWAYNASTINSTTPVFIESGIIEGSFCGSDNCPPKVGPYRVPRYFWGDSRCCGKGFHEHVDISETATLNQYHNNYIRDEGNDTWYVQSGPWSGDSTSNPMYNDLLVTGTEDTTQNQAWACNGQSGVGRYTSLQAAQSKQLTSGWPGAYDPYYGTPEGPVAGKPPWVDFLGDGHWHDWAAPNETGSKDASADACYGNGSAGDEPNLPGLPESIPDPTSGAGSTNTASSTTSSSTTLSESQIKSIALGYSTSFGDPNPTSIEHVESPRNQAAFQSSDDVVPDTRDTFLIALQGNFVDHHMAQPVGGSPLSGSVLTLIVDAHTGELTDLGVQNNVPNLSSLGPVTVDH